MNKKEYHKHLKSFEWEQKRDKILRRDNNKCQYCNSGMNLNVHHMFYLNNNQ